MTYDNSNIFAKILRGELPSIKVFEDESTLAFMDIMPQADGHTLVIPKESSVDLMTLSDSACAELIINVKRIAQAVKTALNAHGITVFQLNGEAAGQTVPHIHFHVLPGSILDARQHGTICADADYLEAIAVKIRSALASPLTDI
jgi:histidine triad (HIT) family protein